MSGQAGAGGAGAPKIGRFVKNSTPYWPPQPQAPKGAPNILVVLFDDVGFSDFGCYGSPIATPTIDRLAGRGPALHRLPHHGDVLDHARGAC